MTIQIRLQGVEEQAGRLRDAERAVGRIEARVVNEVAAETRRDALLKPIREATGLAATQLNKRITLRRARIGNPVAEIRADGSGIPATLFRFWVEQVTATRGRIRVPWVGGSKLVAGFVNPRGEQRLPLRSYNRKVGRHGKVYTYAIKKQYSKVSQDNLDIALAPSAARMVREQIAQDEPGLKARIVETLAARMTAALAREIQP